jgi:hypothetical protein
MRKTNFLQIIIFSLQRAADRYWNLWRLVAWELAVSKAVRASMERRRVRAIIAMAERQRPTSENA